MPWRSPPRKSYKPKDPSLTSAVMASVKGKNNKAEMALRKELWRRGFRYRLYAPQLGGKPDIVFTRSRLVIFVDGDFWHGRAVVEEGVEAMRAGLRTERREWWLNKIGRTVERDKKVSHQLTEVGWNVMRFWESSVKADINGVADIISERLREASNNG